MCLLLAFVFGGNASFDRRNEVMLFGKKNKGKTVQGACRSPAEHPCCGEVVHGVCRVKVLGTGCKSCHELYENTRTAVKHAGLTAEVEYVTDMEKVMTYGTMRMPVLVVNERVVSMGRVLKPTEIEKLLK